MPEQSNSTSTSTSYSVREAADICGVSTDTIKRRLADSRFPTAEQQAGRTGPEWRIPAKELAQVAEADGWTLHLAAAEPPQKPELEQQQTETTFELIERIQAETAARATATAKLEQSEGKAMQLESSLKQARTDAEHWRAEHDRRIQELSESEKAKSVAEALAEERQNQLNHERSTVAENQAQLDAERELTAQQAAELASVGERASELEKLASERLLQTEKLKDSMGWWSRRRFEKRQ